MQWRAAVENPALPGTMLLPLSKGMFAVVDAADADVVSKWRWSARPSGRTTYGQRIEKGVRLSLHGFLWRHWGMPETPEVDHENGNGLDCRRENLRAATHSQNMKNMRRSKANTSGVKGVSWDRRRGRWAAEVKADGRRRRSRFALLSDAVEFTTTERKDLHGAFANHGTI